MSLFPEKKSIGVKMQDKLIINKDPLGHVKLGHLFKEYCVKFACNYDEARYQM